MKQKTSIEDVAKELGRDLEADRETLAEWFFAALIYGNTDVACEVWQCDSLDSFDDNIAHIANTFFGEEHEPGQLWYATNLWTGLGEWMKVKWMERKPRVPPAWEVLPHDPQLNPPLGPLHRTGSILRSVPDDPIEGDPD